MSFTASSNTALPAEVQLAKEKPQGAFCLRSRYALSANSANSWLAGALVSLPLQTGTPGTFTDVKQGNINCTLQISNTNPYVDFLNFGPCGAMIFFDEMRIYSSGTPVEENLRYSETVDLLMEQGGWQCRPLHVFRRNKWRAANGKAGDKHINFIKPSMTDVTGVPMFGRTPFMDKNSAVYQPPSIAIGYEPYNPGGAVPAYTLAANAVTDAAFRSASKGNATAFSHGAVLGQDSGYTFNDDGISPATAIRAAANFYVSGTLGAGFQTTNIVGRNATVVKTNVTTASTVYLNDQAAWRNTQVGRTNADVGVNGYTWLPCASFVPSQWPDYQPCTISGDVDDFEIDGIIGKTKVAEYMKYLSNVRSLPVGLSGNNTSYTSNVDALQPASSAVQNAPNCRFVEYRVSMPFISGIYGILADKMFPDLLIGANNIRIEFKLAQNSKALWLTMDPCRRVPGTVRDFTPFTGEVSGGARGGRIVAGTTTPFSTSAVATSAALGCFYSRVLPYDTGSDAYYSATTHYQNSATAAQGVITSTIYGIVRDSNMYNTSSALGEDLIANQMQGTLANVNEVLSVSNGINGGGHYATFSYLPKPQYIPSDKPWSTKSYFTAAGADVAASHCNENAACFGTYLPASCPQTRRCQPTSRLAIADNFTSAGTTVFAIRDLQYIGEQVQLDDIAASALIQHAATSEIVVWTRGYRSFEANCTVGEQQNIILPIQIGQATALYLVFRPGTQLQSFDYYSNSFSCPFTGLSFNGSQTGQGGGSLSSIYFGKGGKTADVGGLYTIQSSLDTQNMGLFSYQLFSGTRQYPLQPIQTVSELLVEREKSTHSLHNWSWTGTENMNLTSWGKSFSSSNTNGYQFDPFLDLGYFTTFVPVAALDDQTITQNPYFSIAEVDEQGTAKTRIRGIRQSAQVLETAGQFVGVLNTYVPPIGTFFLGWDFESWTNHEDLMRTGKFLGQEQLSVRMTGTYLMSATNPSSPNGGPTVQPIMCTAIVPHVVKLSFIPGGHMLSYY
jgi:hypothetical protein